MSDYEQLIDLRNRIQESDFGFEEDVQLLDRVLDYYENTTKQCQNQKAIEILYELSFTLYESHYIEDYDSGKCYITLEDNEKVINSFIDKLKNELQEQK